MILTLLILFLSHLLGGVAAFGSTLLALPVLLMAGWELRSAVALLLICGTAQALNLAWLTWRDADRQLLPRILLIAGIGIPLGFGAAAWLPEAGLNVALGLLLAVAGLYRLVEHARAQRWQPPAWLLNLLLLVGGIIHGAFGSGGTTLIVYARFALPEKRAFRGTLSVMWTILNIVVIIGLLVERTVDAEVLVTSLPAVPLIFLATWLGNRLAERVSQERFADFVALLLCLAGALTIIRNLG